MQLKIQQHQLKREASAHKILYFSELCDIYSIFGFYYNDSKFLENLLIAAQDELINNSTERDALGLYNATYPGNQTAINLFSRHDALTRIYSVLTDKLSYVKRTGNIGYLADIQYILAAYKNAL